MLEFISKHQEYTGSLTAVSEGEKVGRIDFVPASPTSVDLIHTEVFPQFEGRGYGRALVAASVAFARAEGLKLLASCPFAARVLDRNPEWQDVWKKT